MTTKEPGEFNGGTIGFYGIPLDLMGFSIVFDGIFPWDFMWIPLGFHVDLRGFNGDLMGFTGI